MKNTPSINGSNGNGSAKNGQNGTTHVIEPGQVVNLGDALKKMNGKKDTTQSEETPAETAPEATPAPAVEPTAAEESTPARVETPPAPAVEPVAPAPVEPTPAPAAEPTTAQAPAPVATEAAKPVRSRMEEIQYWSDKVHDMGLVKRQLNSLIKKSDDLKDFRFANEESEDSRYGRVVLYDDNNHMFECRNHGVAAFVAEKLKEVFAEKIQQKEDELLRVALG
jgi:hypothetical protein